MLLLNEYGIEQIRLALGILVTRLRGQPALPALQEILCRAVGRNEMFDRVCEELSVHLIDLRAGSYGALLDLEDAANTAAPTLIMVNTLLSGLLNGLLNGTMIYDERISRLHNSYVTTNGETMRWTHAKLVEEYFSPWIRGSQLLDEFALFELLMHQCHERVPKET